MKEIKLDEISNNQLYYILMCGSVGSGKNYIVQTYLNHIPMIDIDYEVIKLGNGLYDTKNITRAKLNLETLKNQYFLNKTSFIHQGTSANFNNTLVKLKNAKDHGFKTILIYVNTPIEVSFDNIKNRIMSGGHGSTITLKKLKNTYEGSKYTFDNLMKNTTGYLDYYAKVDNFNVK